MNHHNFMACHTSIVIRIHTLHTKKIKDSFRQFYQFHPILIMMPLFPYQSQTNATSLQTKTNGIKQHD